MLNVRQVWLLVHIGLGSGFLHGFLVGARTLTAPHLGAREERARNRALLTMAVAAWLTVVTGTWTVYAWYRAKPIPGASSLSFPKSWLTASHRLAVWHDFGMEWKEHIGWLAPILATAVSTLVIRHQPVLSADWRARRLVTAMFSLALLAALVAAVLGAAINKVAPNQFLSL